MLCTVLVLIGARVQSGLTNGDGRNYSIYLDYLIHWYGKRFRIKLNYLQSAKD